MRRVVWIIVGVLIGLAVGAGAATARDGQAPEALGGASAPGVRMAAFIDGAITPGQFTVVRSKGVAQVTNPEQGTFCIKPTSGSGVSQSTAIPVLSHESSRSGSFNMHIEWVTPRQACPTGAFEVVTLVDNNNGTASAYNEVAFTIVVP